jgi:ribosome-binding factor A
MDRKAMQLCSQVRYALEYAVNAAVKGEYGLTISEVVPAPNTSHLLVLVQPFDQLSFEESMRIEEELKRQTACLRAAVSESIHRRKTPGLSFQIVPRSIQPSAIT